MLALPGPVALNARRHMERGAGEREVMTVHALRPTVSRVSLPLRGIPHVVGLGSGLKMGRIDARRVVAPMPSHALPQGFSKRLFQHDAMNSPMIEQRVAKIVARPIPLPASRVSDGPTDRADSHQERQVFLSNWCSQIAQILIMPIAHASRSRVPVAIRNTAFWTRSNSSRLMLGDWVSSAAEVLVMLIAKRVNFNTDRSITVRNFTCHS